MDGPFKRPLPPTAHSVPDNMEIKIDSLADYCNLQSTLRKTDPNCIKMLDNYHSITLDIRTYLKNHKKLNLYEMEEQAKTFLNEWLADCNKNNCFELGLVKRLKAGFNNVLIQDIAYLVAEKPKSCNTRRNMLKEDYLRSVFPDEMDVLYPIEDDVQKGKGAVEINAEKQNESPSKRAKTGKRQIQILAPITIDPTEKIRKNLLEKARNYFARQNVIRSSPIECDKSNNYTSMDNILLKVYRDNHKLFEQWSEDKKREIQRIVFGRLGNMMAETSLSIRGSCSPELAIKFEILTTHVDVNLQFDAYTFHHYSLCRAMPIEVVIQLQSQYIVEVFGI